MSSAADRITAAGYEDVVIFEAPSYDSALIGITDDNRAVYSYDLMLEYLQTAEGMSFDEAAEWLDYNTLRALPYMGESAPVVMYTLE